MIQSEFHSEHEFHWSDSLNVASKVLTFVLYFGSTQSHRYWQTSSDHPCIFVKKGLKRLLSVYENSLVDTESFSENSLELLTAERKSHISCLTKKNS